jgi:UDP-3-O-[3-hydroxymyristoyl] glucosamine N-acyltransferase
MGLQLGEIVASLGGELHGDAALRIEALAPLESAGPAQLAFLSHPRYRSQLDASRAGCVIVAPALREAALARGACIVADDPYLYFARLTQLWKRAHARPAGPAIHPSAVIDPEAVVAPDAPARASTAA